MSLNGALIIAIANAVITVTANSGIRYNVDTTSANIVPALGILEFAAPIQQQHPRMVKQINVIIGFLSPS